MTDTQRMTTQQLVRRTLLDEHGDFLREAVALVAAQLMDAEVTAQIGAGHGEVSADRVTHRNGYRSRGWETRVGEIELQIPKKRSGSYFPSFLEPRRRCEQAIVAVVMEAYVNGVSTRKVDRLVEQLGIHGMSKDRVSALCRALDDQVQAFCERPLEGAHPYLWLDAKVVKVRDRGHVYPKALVVAYSVHETGRREVIGLDIGEIETEAFWVMFLRSLRERGLTGVRLCVSDEHLGLKHAIARVLGCPWQRCTVHFVRDMGFRPQVCVGQRQALVAVMSAKAGEEPAEKPHRRELNGGAEPVVIAGAVGDPVTVKIVRSEEPFELSRRRRLAVAAVAGGLERTEKVDRHAPSATVKPELSAGGDSRSCDAVSAATAGSYGGSWPSATRARRCPPRDA